MCKLYLSIMLILKIINNVSKSDWQNVGKSRLVVAVVWGREMGSDC